MEHMNHPATPGDGSRDEQLFQALADQKKRRRRRILITVISIVLVAAIVLTVTVFYLRQQVREKYVFTGQQVLSYTVQTGTLSTVVSGSGILAEEDLEALTVPEGVEITRLLVEDSAPVTQGQLLALVEPASVTTAMAQIQTQMKTLDQQIAAAEDDQVSATITAGVAGRVKVIYAQPGMTVAECMTAHGALMVLSLDGYMCVEIPAGDLQPGDPVTVTREVGRELPGQVDTVIGGSAIVLVSDDGPLFGETVTVSREGEALGSGQLAIHEPLAVIGYTGTVKSLSAAENRRVTRGTTLLRLTDTGTTAQYDSLLRQRRELEETLLELLAIQRSGGVTAPFDGSVYTLDYDETTAPLAVVTLSRDEKMTITLTVDETDILSLKLGQTAEITIPSLGDVPVMGTVTEINRTAGESGFYSAVVTLTKESGMLAGMTADVSIRIQGVENAMLIPLDALHQTRTGAFVYTTYDAQTETFGGEQTVTVGILGANEAEILSGLNPGDVIWYTEEQTFMDFFMGGMGGSSGSGRTPAGQSSPGGQGGPPSRPD